MGTLTKKSGHTHWDSTSFITRLMDAAYGVGLFMLNQSSKLLPAKKHCKDCSSNVFFKPRALNKGEVCENCGRSGTA